MTGAQEGKRTQNQECGQSRKFPELVGTRGLGKAAQGWACEEEGERKG